MFSAQPHRPDCAIPHPNNICTPSAKQFPLASLSNKLSLTKLNTNGKRRQRESLEMGKGSLLPSFPSNLSPSVPFFLSNFPPFSGSFLYRWVQEPPSPTKDLYVYADYLSMSKMAYLVNVGEPHMRAILKPVNIFCNSERLAQTIPSCWYDTESHMNLRLYLNLQSSCFSFLSIRSIEQYQQRKCDYFNSDNFLFCLWTYIFRRHCWLTIFVIACHSP